MTSDKKESFCLAPLQESFGLSYKPIQVPKKSILRLGPICSWEQVTQLNLEFLLLCPHSAPAKLPNKDRTAEPSQVQSQALLPILVDKLAQRLTVLPSAIVLVQKHLRCNLTCLLSISSELAFQTFGIPNTPDEKYLLHTWRKPFYVCVFALPSFDLKYKDNYTKITKIGMIMSTWCFSLQVLSTTAWPHEEHTVSGWGYRQPPLCSLQPAVASALGRAKNLHLFNLIILIKLNDRLS